jgi:hypothetical protein
LPHRVLPGFAGLACALTDRADAAIASTTGLAALRSICE